MTARIFSNTRCELGEGPMWHPLRQQLFWFDILGKRMLTRTDHGETGWTFEDHVSAAGWVDQNTLILASATALWKFSIATGARSKLIELEADNPVTRSNDGRADPWGGFWIGTMGLNAEPQAGAIYRYYRGALRKLVGDMTITNAICFAPDRSAAYYCDTDRGQILRQPLAPDDGWPVGDPSVFLDAASADWGCDGAVVDAEGCLWNAQWGAARVARYAPAGALIKTYPFPALQTSCPAFGGPDLTTMFVTSAAIGLDGADQGLTYAWDVGIKGQAEHQVIL